MTGRGRRGGPVVPFWRWTQGFARELLGREPVPGDDYALSEVVHCGSQHETGVAAALGTCTSRYLRRVLAASPARVVIVVGATARGVFESQFRAQFTGNVHRPSPSAWVWQRGELAGRARCVLALPHPNARVPAHSVTGNLGPQLTADIARFISSGAPHEAKDREQPPFPAAEHRPARSPQVYAITTRKRDRNGDPDLMPGLNYVVAAVRTPWKPGAIRVIHVTGTDPHWHPGQLVDLINAATGLRLGQYEVRAAHQGRADGHVGQIGGRRTRGRRAARRAGVLAVRLA